MSLIKKKFLSTGAVAKLLNNVFIQGRNAANSADVDILKLNASDKAEIGVDLVPSSDIARTIGSGSFRFLSAYINTLRAQDASIVIDLVNKNLINDSAVSVLNFSGTNAETSVAPTTANHIVNKDYADTKLDLAGGTMTGAIAMGGNKITGLDAPTANGDALRYDMLGANSGIATLDGSGKIPVGQLPNSVAVWSKESITLGAGDITNQYVDLAETIKASSLDLVVDGVMQTEGVDYTISLTGGSGGVTRLTFAGDLATGGASELVATDILRLKYQY